MTTLQELKEREIGLLNSHNSRYIEYGKACKEILDMCNSYSKFRLSEQVLISDMAEKYAQKEKKLYDLTNNEKYRLHIKLASEYYLKNFISFDELYNILSQEERILTFEEAKNIILQSPEVFIKVKTNTLLEVLKKIELDLKETE
jgi:hypothetical protein